MVLQRTGHDFRCGRGPLVDEDDDRLALRVIAGSRVVALNVVLLAPDLRNDLAVVEKGVGTLDRLVEQPSTIGAEVVLEAQDTLPLFIPHCCNGLASPRPAV